jgi:VanZ family protein
VLPLQYQRRWKIAGVLLLIAVLTGAMAPPLFPWSGTGSPSLMLSDKWLHGITFASMVVWYSGQYARRSYWLLALGLLAFGLLIEFCQSLVSYRTAESGDLIADILGILVGLAIALVGLGGWSARVESWLQSKHG